MGIASRGVFFLKLLLPFLVEVNEKSSKLAAEIVYGVHVRVHERRACSIVGTRLLFAGKLVVVNFCSFVRPVFKEKRKVREFGIPEPDYPQISQIFAECPI